jgi:phosphonate transport system permease protein
LSSTAAAAPRTALRLGAPGISALVGSALALAAWLSLLGDGSGATGSLLSSETWHRIGAFVASLLGRPTELAPRNDATAFLSAERWLAMADLARATLAMSVLAIGIAGAGALLTVMVGARPGEAARTEPLRAARWAAYGLVRASWIGARAVPELVWALLLVLVMPPGLLAGALALGLHNLGILGKLGSEVVENLDPAPARALRVGGGGPLQLLAYAVLPQALPQFLTFALYRWEVIIRTTIVVGFVGAGGLGREFRLAMSFFHYTDVAMILATYFALVLGVDFVSARLRSLAQG